MRQAPRTLGIDRSRWRLVDLLACAPELNLTTPQALGRLLRRLGIRSKRARAHVHSPDPQYAAKQALIAQVRATAQRPAAQAVLLYLDEASIGRQPTVAAAWAGQGRDQPLARRSHAADTETRILGALDAATGAVHSLLTTKVRVATLVRFYQQVVAAYPAATQLWVVTDNWPVHFHPDLFVALEPQHNPFPRYVPPAWPYTPSPAAVRKWGALRLPIQVLPLPTYAPWCNPIEQVWRKLRQELGHLHPWAADLLHLRHELGRWLAAAAQPSGAMLHYVGLATHD